MGYKKLYETNDDFKLYVDKYAKEFGLSIETALSHKIVQIIGEDICERGKTDDTDRSYGRN